MDERNEFLEIDGKFFESDTHEWFRDKVTTSHAHKKDTQGISLKNLYACIVREKSTGVYSRVLMEIDSSKVVYSCKSGEEIWDHVDRLRLLERFEIK